jgi:hypothetical protein
MYKQVPVVAILMIVQGVLEILMGGLLVVIAAIITPLMEEAMRQQPGGPPPGMPLMPGDFATLAMAIYLVMGIAALLAAPLRIIAGIRNLRYRGRGLGITALFVGGLSMATCYCAPTSLGVMIYGLIVYFNESTARAFELGEQGMTTRQIRDTLDRRRPYRERDEERDEKRDEERDEKRDRWDEDGGESIRAAP